MDTEQVAAGSDDHAGQLNEVPERIPARMLNEYVYCPRLFYLEWVDDRWADNADTEQGRFAHRAVDKQKGVLPDPKFADLLKRASSVQIESTRLGLIAVIDRVEGQDGRVMPVDTKKGHPNPDGQPWPADRIQVLTQAALLADAGYMVDRAVLYYAETHQRVDIPVSQAEFDEVADVAAAARQVASQPRPPLPLLHSPKCPRCSLVGLCLPDETNSLLARDETPARTIVPRPRSSPVVYHRTGRLRRRAQWTAAGYESARRTGRGPVDRCLSVVRVRECPGQFASSCRALGPGRAGSVVHLRRMVSRLGTG